jgi:hypothetical protein
MHPFFLYFWKKNNMWDLIIDNKKLRINYDPKPTYAYGLLGEVGQINNLVTRDISIEKSPESCAFFEYANLYNVISTLPKRVLSVALTFNSEIVIESARVERFEVKKNEFRLILASKHRDLIDVLSPKLSTISWADFDIEFIIRQAEIGFALQKSMYAVPYISDLIPINHLLLPSIQVKELFFNIFIQNGIELFDVTTQSVFVDSIFERYYLQATDFKPAISVDTFTAAGYVPTNYPAGRHVMPHTPIDTASGTKYFFEEADNYRIKLNTRADFEINLNTFSSSVGFAEIVVELQTVGGGFLDEVYRGLASNNAFFTVPASSYGTGSGLYLAVYLECATTTLFQLIEYNGTNENFSVAGEILGETYSFKNNLPDISQIEFVKFVLMLTSKFITYDNINKKAYLFDYESLLLKEPIDLTDNIVNFENIDIDFSGDLAQSNTFEYTNESPVTPDFGRGELLFINVNCPEKRTFYKAPFGLRATTNRQNKNVLVPSIIPESGIVEVDYKSMKPYLFTMLTSDTFTAKQVNGFTSWPEILDYYHQHFKDQLADYKQITVEAKLSLSDLKLIDTPDDQRPILINNSKISGLFKVNSVQYVANGISTISLTKLNIN